MIRKVLWITALAVTSILPLGTAGSLGRADEKPSDKAGASKAAPYVHAVIMFVKKDAPEGETEALIADAHELLGKIPSVRELKIGRPAEKSTPMFAQKDYQVGLLVLFDNYDGLKEYLDHPKHGEYVDKHLKHLDRVLAYDFINQKK